MAGLQKCDEGNGMTATASSPPLERLTHSPLTWLSTSGLIGSGMVIQRELPIRLHGRAAPGRLVTVKLGHEVSRCTAGRDGNWQIVFAPRQAGGPIELTIHSGNASLAYRDIWIGEVWLCAGQSNIIWRIDRMPPAPRSAHLDFLAGHDIRLAQVPPRSAAEAGVPLPSCRWTGTPNHLLPALPASLAIFLEKVVPCKVGLIVAGIGGSPVSTWIPRDEFSLDPVLRDYLSDYPPDPPGYEETHAVWRQERAAWDRANEVRVARGEDPLTPGKTMFWGPPGTRCLAYPGGAFEAMIEPALRHSIRGVLWYQGETDAEFPVGYSSRLKRLVEGWRRRIANRAFPFVVVQIPAIAGLDSTPNWPAIRHEQQQATDTLHDTTLVPTLDLADPAEVHPSNKRAFAERLAPVLAAWSAGKRPPQAVRILGFKQTAADRIALSLSGASLPSADAIPGFEIEREDGGWLGVPAYWRSPRTLELALPEAWSIRGIRYLWAPAPEVRLHDSRDWPILPFCSRNIPPPGSVVDMY